MGSTCDLLMSVHGKTLIFQVLTCCWNEPFKKQDWQVQLCGFQIVQENNVFKSHQDTWEQNQKSLLCVSFWFHHRLLTRYELRVEMFNKVIFYDTIKGYQPFVFSPKKIKHYQSTVVLALIHTFDQIAFVCSTSKCQPWKWQVLSRLLHRQFDLTGPLKKKAPVSHILKASGLFIILYKTPAM